jgi:hypothetical protein
VSLEYASTATSQSRSGSRSPAFAKLMMALAIASRGASSTPQLWRVHAPIMEGSDGELERDP